MNKLENVLQLFLHFARPSFNSFLSMGSIKQLVLDKKIAYEKESIIGKCILPIFLNAQTGINTNNPVSTLDIMAIAPTGTTINVDDVAYYYFNGTAWKI